MWFKWLLVALFALSIFLTVKDVGEPREPQSPLTAAFVVLIDGLLMAGILYYWK